MASARLIFYPICLRNFEKLHCCYAFFLEILHYFSAFFCIFAPQTIIMKGMDIALIEFMDGQLKQSTSPRVADPLSAVPFRQPILVSTRAFCRKFYA